MAGPLDDLVQANAAPSAGPLDDLVRTNDNGETFKPWMQQDETSTSGAFAAGALRGAVPAVGTLAGAAAGAEAGGAVGALGGPIGALAGGFIGGLGGALLGGAGADEAQDYAVSKLPNSWSDPLTKYDAAAEQEHPYASMLGGLTPFMLTMTPTGAVKGAAKATTALGRIMEHPATARAFGGAMQGGLELFDEERNGETPDWAKVAIATGFGTVFNRPNRIGERIDEIAGSPIRALRERQGATGAHVAPTIAQVKDAKVIGEGITEEVASGSAQMNPQAEMVAQEGARTEASIIAPAPPPPVADVARRLDPELFEERDAALAKRDAIAAVSPDDERLSKIDKELQGIDAQITASHQRAAEATGAETVETPLEGVGNNNAILNPLLTPQESAVQEARIAADVERRLIVAGRPEDEAKASAAVDAAGYVQWARRTGTTPEEFYAREHPEIRGVAETPLDLPPPPAPIRHEPVGHEPTPAIAPLEGEILPPATTRAGSAEWLKGMSLPAKDGGSVPVPTRPDMAETALDDAVNAGWIDKETADKTLAEVKERWDSVHAPTVDDRVQPIGVETTPQLPPPEPAPIKPVFKAPELEVAPEQSSVEHFAPEPEPEPEEEAPGNNAIVSEKNPTDNFIAAVKDRLTGGQPPFRNIVEARNLAREHGLEFAEGESANKAVDELVERAVVESAREIVARHLAEGRPPSETFAEMVKLYENQPNLSSRTSASVAEQAYSTPAPLAYVASRLAGIDRESYVLEPTAGNGMLLMEADPARTRANELNARRAESLAAQGFQPTRDDAADPNTFRNDAGRMDAVIANPPFGAVREGGASKVFKIGDFATTSVDHAIALNALQAMKADGKAVLIVGGLKGEDRAEGYAGKAKRRFYHQILSNYKVSDIFTVSGDLYTRQGAGWPVDVIVIDGKGKSDRAPLTKIAPPLLNSWAEVGAKLNDAAIRQPETPEPPGPDRPPSRDTVERQPGPQGGNGVGGEAAVREPTVGGPTPAEAAGVVGGTSDTPEPGPDGSEHAVPVGESSQAGQGRDVREPGPPVNPDRGRAVAAEVTGGQTPYEPASQRGVKLNTLLPANLRNATNSSLDRLEREHGDVDHYVAEKIGRSPDELGKYFSAEQIDAIGLGISNIDRGEGFIIGDQTGIGKGRVVAAMISYAKRKGLVPIFVTEKPDLYGDMWRDLHDIGWDKQLGRPIEMMMTNSDARVPLDDEALEWQLEADEARENGRPPPPRRGDWTKPQSKDKATAAMRGIIRGENTPDVVFTTYDQMNSVKGSETDRRNFLRIVAPKSFLIMDEAHNAGGQGSDPLFKVKGAPPRSDLFREAVDKAASVMYSSATYAKNPAVMTLYSKTDMAKAVENVKMLPELIEKGGVPLQQVVAGMLARAGQYMRRERSFEGVSYDHESIPVSDKAYSEFTEGLGAVFRFDQAFGRKERKDLGNAQAAETGAGMGKDSGTGETGASSTTFGAVMHNVISQMIMALKAEKAGERAVEAIKAGEKPVVGLSKTNDAFIQGVREDQGLKVGDVANISFRDVLQKYLERTRRVTIKLGSDEKVHYTIPLEDMSPQMQAMYHAAEDTLNEMDVGDLPISPIDAMRNVIQKAGYTVREVTGRGEMLDYSEKEPVIVRRPASEIGASGKKMTVKAFNDGRLDAVILNKSGSTGISMHASSKFKDQRKRRMIIAEADPNIDTHMQMLGRVHRTGQVIPPAYTHLSAAIPAEERPTAVLMKKMASLNANTTGAKTSKFTSEGSDFMNKYGDQAVAEILTQDPYTREALGLPENAVVGEGGGPAPGAAAKATGHLTLLKPEQQQEFLDQVQSSYKSIIEALDASGTNDLEAKSMDLGARVLESQTIKPASGPSPFQGAVNLDKVSVKSQGRAMAPSEVLDHVAKAVGGEAKGEFPAELARLGAEGRKRQGEMLADAGRRADQHLKDVVSALKDPEARQNAEARANENFNRLRETAAIAYPGASVDIRINGEETPAVVIGFRQKEPKNPTALSSWDVTFALPNGQRSLGVPLTQIALRSDENVKPGAVVVGPGSHSRSELEPMFEQARKEGRENRYMFSGNLLAGFDQVNGRGQIINHTMEDGSTRSAILMNRQFNATDFMEKRAIRFANGEHAMKYLEGQPNGEIKSTDEVVTVRNLGYGRYEFEVPAARGVGGRYYADSTVRAAYDNWERRGSKMRAQVNGQKATELLNAMMKVDAVFETRENQQAAIDAGKGQELAQSKNASIKLNPGERPVIHLLATANASSFMHETAHDWLEKLLRYGAQETSSADLRADAATARNWLRMSESQARPTTAQHERFARGFEQYLRNGVAPSPRLAGVFAQFRNWLAAIYRSAKRLGAPISPDIQGVFDRMLAHPTERTVITPETVRGKSLADIHEDDAASATDDERIPNAERIDAEREQHLSALPENIANEFAKKAEEQVAEQREPGAAAPDARGETGEGTSGKPVLGEAGGGPESFAGGGGNSLESREERAGVGQSESGGGGTATRPEQRPVSGENARDGGRPTPRPPDTIPDEPEFVDKAGNIRLDKLMAPEEVKDVIREVAAANNDFIGDRRGVVTVGQTMDLADALGMEYSGLLQRRVGQAFSAEEVVAAKRLLVQSATDVRGKASAYAQDGSPASLQAYAAAADRHRMVQGQVAGITAEAGRTLAIFRQVIGGESEAGAVGEIISKATGQTLYQIGEEAKLVSAMDTPEKISKFMDSKRKRSFADMILEYWINGLISGLGTHVTYGVGNSILSAIKAGPETLAAAAIGRLREQEGRQRVYAGEAGQQFRGALRALPGALATASESFKAGVTARLPGEKGFNAPFQPEAFAARAPSLIQNADYRQAAAGAFGVLRGMRDSFVAGAALLKAGGVEGEPTWGLRSSPLGAIPDITYKGVGVLPIGTAARVPSRFIASVHSFFRAMNYSMEKSALAYRTAMEEAAMVEGGQDDAAIARRTAELRAFPTDQIMQASAQEATNLTLMGKGGEFTQALSRLTNARIFGIKLLKFIDPFVHISSNIIEEALLKRTPVGFLSPAIRADLSGANGSIAADRAAARMLVGGVAAMTFGGLAASGYASGSGPTDPRQAAMWRLGGNQAHSVRIGDMWYAVNRLGPMGMLLSTAADMYDVAHIASQGDMLKAGAALQHAITQNILDESFMRGPADLIQAVEDPGRYGEAYLRNWASSFMPYSIAMAQAARGMDPYARQARTVMDEIRAKTPGLSEGLFPRRDVWGEAMPSGDALIHSGVTAIYTRMLSHDPVNVAMLQLGIGPAQMLRSIRGVQLTDEQYDDFARVGGRMAKQRLDAIVNSQQFASWPGSVKHDVIIETIKQSWEAARGWMMMKYPSIIQQSFQNKTAKMQEEDEE